MCGIVGIVSREDAVERLVAGLRGLEYRGYDSAGIATRTSGVDIGHTRWATHGAPSGGNAPIILPVTVE